MECLLQIRVVFAGCEGYHYTHIQIKGKGIVVRDITRQEAKEIMDRLEYAHPDTYAQYDYRLGNIYTDTKFKSYLNKHKNVKKNLFTILNNLDNV